MPLEEELTEGIASKMSELVEQAAEIIGQLNEISADTLVLMHLDRTQLAELLASWTIAMAAMTSKSFTIKGLLVTAQRLADEDASAAFDGALLESMERYEALGI